MDATPVRMTRRRAAAAFSSQAETPVPRRRRRTASPDETPLATPIRGMSASGRRSVGSVERFRELLQEEDPKPTPSPAPKFAHRLLALEPQQSSEQVERHPLLLLGPQPNGNGEQLFSFNSAVYRVKNTEAFQKVLSDVPKRSTATLMAAQRAARAAEDAIGAPPQRCCLKDIPAAKPAEKPDIQTILSQLVQAMDEVQDLTEVRVQKAEAGQVDFAMDGNVYRASEETFLQMLPPRPEPRKPRSLAELRAAQRARAVGCQESSTRWPSQLPAAASTPRSASGEAVLAMVEAAEHHTRATGGA